MGLPELCALAWFMTLAIPLHQWWQCFAAGLLDDNVKGTLCVTEQPISAV